MSEAAATLPTKINHRPVVGFTTIPNSGFGIEWNLRRRPQASLHTISAVDTFLEPVKDRNVYGYTLFHTVEYN